MGTGTDGVGSGAGTGTGLRPPAGDKLQGIGDGFTLPLQTDPADGERAGGRTRGLTSYNMSSGGVGGGIRLWYVAPPLAAKRPPNSASESATLRGVRAGELALYRKGLVGACRGDHRRDSREALGAAFICLKAAAEAGCLSAAPPEYRVVVGRTAAAEYARTGFGRGGGVRAAWALRGRLSLCIIVAQARRSAVLAQLCVCERSDERKRAS